MQPLEKARRSSASFFPTRMEDSDGLVKGPKTHRSWHIVFWDKVGGVGGHKKRFRQETLFPPTLPLEVLNLKWPQLAFKFKDTCVCKLFCRCFLKLNRTTKRVGEIKRWTWSQHVQQEHVQLAVESLHSNNPAKRPHFKTPIQKFPHPWEFPVISKQRYAREERKKQRAQTQSAKRRKHEEADRLEAALSFFLIALSRNLFHTSIKPSIP